MPRVTPAELRKILDTDDRRWPDLTPFITAANALVTAVCTASGYPDSLLKEIEKWLAGHFYCTPEPLAVVAKIGESQDTYESKVDLYLANSRYGQQAMILDYKGNLAGVSNSMKRQDRRSAKTKWLGDNSCCDNAGPYAYPDGGC